MLEYLSVGLENPGAQAGVCGAPCGDRRLSLGLGGLHWAPGVSWRSGWGVWLGLGLGLGDRRLSLGVGVRHWAPGGSWRSGWGVWSSMRG